MQHCVLELRKFGFVGKKNKLSSRADLLLTRLMIWLLMSCQRLIKSPPHGKYYVVKEMGRRLRHWLPLALLTSTLTSLCKAPSFAVRNGCSECDEWMESYRPYHWLKCALLRVRHTEPVRTCKSPCVGQSSPEFTYRIPDLTPQFLTHHTPTVTGLEAIIWTWGRGQWERSWVNVSRCIRVNKSQWRRCVTPLHLVLTGR